MKRRTEQPRARRGRCAPAPYTKRDKTPHKYSGVVEVHHTPAQDRKPRGTRRYFQKPFARLRDA